MTAFGAVNSATALSRQLVIELSDFRMGATAPTSSTVGTTPTVPTLLFAATNELLSLGTLMPLNWDKTVSANFIMVWALAATQLNADALDVTVDYIVFDKDTTGAGLTKTSTQLTPSTSVTTGNGLAIADVYMVSSVMAFNDASNPFAVNSNGIAVEIHLTNVTGVASAHFIGACIDYRALH